MHDLIELSVWLRRRETLAAIESMAFDNTGYMPWAAHAKGIERERYNRWANAVDAVVEVVKATVHPTHSCEKNCEKADG